LALVGPTARGKTAVAQALAQQFTLGNHQCGFSFGLPEASDACWHCQTYSSMAERASVVHAPDRYTRPCAQSYSAADFARDATQLIGDIRARGKLPLLVGGTLLYVKALMDGFESRLPLANPKIRADIEEEAHDQGLACASCAVGLGGPAGRAATPAAT
jgi:tRNA dimethylallyltransferase